MTKLSYVLPFFLAACQPAEGDLPQVPKPTAPPGPTTGTGSTTTVTVTETGDTGLTTTTSSGVYDCSAMPVMPTASTRVTGASAYHGIAFDPADDTLVGHDNGGNLKKVDIAGTASVWTPGIGTQEQMVFLPDGTLATADASGGEIRRVYANGSTELIATVGGTYGLVLGPDDALYAADWDDVVRIDPNTGQQSVVFPGGSYSPKVVAFDSTGTRMYVGTVFDGGDIFVMDFDPATGTVVGPPTLFGSTPGSWHDGLALDICDNVYVAEYNNRGLYRFSPDGARMQTLADNTSNLYGHGITWGRTGGSWNDHGLYQPQPYNGNTVAVIDIGVPSAQWFGVATGTSPL